MRNNLTEGSVLNTIVKMSVPMIWGIMSVIGFNLVDMYFVSTLGENELAAISLTFPVVMFFASLALGVATAVSSLVSRSLGKNDLTKVRRYTSDALTFALLLVIAASTLGFITIEPLFSLLGANEKTMPLVKDYMSIWYSGMIFVAVPMAGNGAIRAKGDTKSASLIMMVAAITNVILDPIFIYGYLGVPAMGMKGAAVATVIARGITLVASLSILHFKYKMLDFKRPKLSDAVTSWRRILFIAIPASGSNVIQPLVLSIITGVVARYGDHAVACFGVVSRIESFAMIVVIAIASSMGPIVGQNFGAMKLERIGQAFYSSVALSFGWSILISFILTTFSTELIGIFNQKDEIIKLGMLYLSVVPMTYGFTAIRMITCSSFNAIGRPYTSTLIIVLNMIVILLPLVLLGASFAQVKGIFYAQGMANILAGLLSFQIMRKYLVEQSSL